MKTSTLLGVGLLFCVVACGPRWTVVRQATPDPFLNHPAFSVEPLHFEPTQVGGKSEAAYLATKDPQQQQTWQADKEAMSERFAAGLAEASDGLQVGGAAAPAGGLVRPVVTFIEPGYYAGISAGSTRVNMTVQILDAQKQVQDEIAISASIGANMVNSASGTRLRKAATELGKITASYLKTRVAP